MDVIHAVIFLWQSWPNFCQRNLWRKNLLHSNCLKFIYIFNELVRVILQRRYVYVRRLRMARKCFEIIMFELMSFFPPIFLRKDQDRSAIHKAVTKWTAFPFGQEEKKWGKDFFFSITMFAFLAPMMCLLISQAKIWLLKEYAFQCFHSPI